MSEQEQPREGWHLKKEVNLTIIISVFAIAVAMVKGYNDLSKDIALIQSDVITLQSNDAKTDDRMREALGAMRTQYQLLDAKLDRLIERTR